jgi:hypothetical protein
VAILEREQFLVAMQFTRSEDNAVDEQYNVCASAMKLYAVTYLRFPYSSSVTARLKLLPPLILYRASQKAERFNIRDIQTCSAGSDKLQRPCKASRQD